MKTQLMDITSLRPSAYNPRQTDPKRLELVELSLRKLGWVLPMVADESGEILSGHQRQRAAVNLGCEQVPVLVISSRDLNERKAMNIVFNRATNDFDRSETEATATEKLNAFDPWTQSSTLADIAIDSPSFFPCLNPVSIPLVPLLQANQGRWKRYTNAIARTLYRIKAHLPILITPDYRVVNGIGRLEILAEKKQPVAECVIISPGQAEFAHAMLNYLTMDFDIHTRYRDFLRHNSFRRSMTVRKSLGIGFIAFLGLRRTLDFQADNPKHWTDWKRIHGTRVLDFGAGHRHETDLLRKHGVEVTPFEPYPIRSDSQKVDKPLALKITRLFLKEVASGKRWSSIFLSAVLNSVPFREDREQIVTLLAALCSPQTRVFASTMAIWHPNVHQVSHNHLMGGKNPIVFPLSYEPGILIGDISQAPKVQKFHTIAEIRELFGSVFGYVNATRMDTTVLCIAKDPRPLDVARLRKAIEFEFDLPYEDGSRMGLVPEAKEAFARRLGVVL